VGRFLAARLARLVAVLLAITVVSFLFMKAIPGDPVAIRLGEHASPAQAAALRTALGLDKPWFVQLGLYMSHAARGDLGTSIVDNQPVITKLTQYFPATVELAVSAMIVAIAGETTNCSIAVTVIATSRAKPIAASPVAMTTGTSQSGSDPHFMAKTSFPAASKNNPWATETMKHGTILPTRICVRDRGAARKRFKVPWRRSATKSQPTINTRKNANMTVYDGTRLW